MNYRIGLLTHKRKHKTSPHTLCGLSISQQPINQKQMRSQGRADHCVSCLDCCALMPKHTYYLVMTNCDCASGLKILTNHPSRNKIGIKCPYCEKILGCMQYNNIQTIRAASYKEAAAILHGYR